MKKIVLSLFIMLTIFSSASAKNIKSSVENIINESGISKSSISVSVINSDNGKTVYALNDKNLMPPASVQKMITIVPVSEILGKDFQLTTQIYSRGKDSYVIKLGGDPYLTSGDLKTLVNKINKETVNKIYIDDSIIEKKSWGEGWQWDDDLNTSILRFNAYNLDNNISKITIMPSEFGQQAKIINISRYPFAFYNNITTGTKNNIKAERDFDSLTNMIILSGTVSSPYSLVIPNNNLKMYFNFKLKEALADRGIYLRKPFDITTIQPSDKLLAEVNHSASDTIKDILINSNNMSIESISKIAAHKKYNKTGTDEDVVKLFSEFCEENKIDNSGIKVVDASGVSKNNLMNSMFIAEYLYKNKDNYTYKELVRPGEGTLANRMIPLKDKLRAKTGTLSDISSIAGFITTKKGNNYIFCIMINEPASTSAAKKVLEDYIIRDLYMNL